MKGRPPSPTSISGRLRSIVKGSATIEACPARSVAVTSKRWSPSATSVIVANHDCPSAARTASTAPLSHFTFTVALPASRRPPRISSEVASMHAFACGEVTNSSGARVSRKTRLVIEAEFPAWSSAEALRVFSPSVKSTGAVVVNLREAIAAGVPLTVTVTASSASPLTIMCAAPMVWSAAGDVNAIRGGVLSIASRSAATVVTRPTASSARIDNVCRPSAVITVPGVYGLPSRVAVIFGVV